ncbi:mRNA-capping enzyme subunit beta [Schizosaccharomyces pombe]|uniref:mRNA-capping enzyme subunit beta n=2 Tax=Schizosaccharomyces pombe TaxID=4896 RepID=CET1_SCHPO|nr:RNA 5'-triphosphatase [Schizosaccharomyces pombe]Q9P6Q6.1 RecName: Full=mRNA-capping enzyme subunit beta; AltName: Full=mRNA 5'-phosphatase; AltName: Full=mRNA 5'-triphosphate monophosphatase [Schizosaccharomyces pombe 972h-]CAB90131.1 RNA 5'-triphosphatase [Schizosaccharomyces pombe]|eukprot:NP_593872.1 RNA 5'-triphosphatase [Schizosaccharomyces pombe]
MDLKGLLHEENELPSIEKRKIDENAVEHDKVERKRTKSVAVPKIEMNFLNKPIVPDTTKVISNFLTHYLITEPVEHVEIEAKLGTLIDLETQNRFEFPVMNETILNPEFNLRTRFESDMTASEHKYLNEFLNQAFRDSQKPGRLPFAYKHTKQVDLFYETEDNSRDKIRVSKNQSDNQVLACVKKRRVADLFLYCPNDAFDIRISISDELPVSMPSGNQQPSLTRLKDRVGYVHQEIKIDLTKTTQNDPVYDTTERHELEVEFGNIADLRDRAQKAKDGMEAPLFRRVQLFMDNVRILRREHS